MKFTEATERLTHVLFYYTMSGQMVAIGCYVSWALANQAAELFMKQFGWNNLVIQEIEKENVPALELPYENNLSIPDGIARGLDQEIFKWSRA